MKRITIRLPDPTITLLQKHASKQGEPAATLAANLLQTSLQQPPPQPPPPPATQDPPAQPSAPQPPPWIPNNQDPNWHQTTWNAITALHQRYPRALRRLEADWHQHPERTETLAALATWRTRIDQTAQDPREELAFHHALQQLQTTLEHTPSSKPRHQAGTSMPAQWLPSKSD
jgi:hypothetical protein